MKKEYLQVKREVNLKTNEIKNYCLCGFETDENNNKIRPLEKKEIENILKELFKPKIK
jgi:hypothetical protein